jgi:hypothetical protein
MDKHEFTALYGQWFALHPFKQRDWPELGKVHYQAFSRESVTMMTEALGQLTEEQSTFPSPADIRKKLNKLSTSKTEGGEGKTNKTSMSEEIATRYLEHKHGVEYNGKPVKCPDPLPLWIKQEVDRVDDMLGPQFPIKSKLGNVGFAIVQKENR